MYIHSNLSIPEFPIGLGERVVPHEQEALEKSRRGHSAVQEEFAHTLSDLCENSYALPHKIHSRGLPFYSITWSKIIHVFPYLCSNFQIGVVQKSAEDGDDGISSSADETRFRQIGSKILQY